MTDPRRRGGRARPGAGGATVLALGLAAFVPAWSCDAGPGPATPQTPLRDEINRARTDPAGYARTLAAHLRALDAQGGYLVAGARVQTREGAAPVREAIIQLQSMRPRPALTSSPCLARAAQAHADDQSRTGAVGHIGADGAGLDARVRREGSHAFTCGENIDYGQPDARGVVVAMLVDDGVPSRGHRVNLLSPQFTRLGVGRATHPRYGVVTVQVMCGPEGPG